MKQWWAIVAIQMTFGLSGCPENDGELPLSQDPPMVIDDSGTGAEEADWQDPVLAELVHRCDAEAPAAGPTAESPAAMFPHGMDLEAADEPEEEAGTGGSYSRSVSVRERSSGPRSAGTNADQPAARGAPLWAGAAEQRGGPDGTDGVSGGEPEDPYSLCGTCDVKFQVWCDVGGHTSWTCVYGDPGDPNAKPVCLYPIVNQVCANGAFDDACECVCKSSGTICGGKDVWENTEGTACGPYFNPPVAYCPPPGCYNGKCSEAPNPTVEAVWPLPGPGMLFEVAPLGPGRAAVGGQTFAEVTHGNWTDLRDWSEGVEEVRAVDMGSDHVPVAITDRRMLVRNADGTWVTTFEFKDTGISAPYRTWIASSTDIWVHDGAVRWRLSNGVWSKDESKLLGWPGGGAVIWGSDPDEPWFVGAHGLAVHRVDGQWTFVPGLNTGKFDDDIQDIHGTKDGKVVAVVRSHRVVWRQSDGTWVEDTVKLDPVEYPNEARPGVRVVAKDDAWAWGARRIWHWDGTGWTQTPSGVRFPDGLMDLECRASDECWAVTAFGAVIRWDGATWMFESEGHQHTEDGGYPTITAIYAPSPDVLYVAAHAGQFNALGDYHDGVTVRRLGLVDGAVKTVRSWSLGTGWIPGDFVGIRSLWGTGEDDVYVPTATPMHWDGHEWAVLDLPQDVLTHYRATSVTGSERHLWVGLQKGVFNSGPPLLAHRELPDGSWSFVSLYDPMESGPWDIAWHEETDTLWVLGNYYLYEVPLGGAPEIVADGAYHYNARLAVSRDGYLMHHGFTQIGFFLVHPDGTVNQYLPGADFLPDWYDYGVANPTGPGFLVVNRWAFELGTPGLEPPTMPINQATQVKMVGELGNHYVTAAHATKWGDVWMAFGIGGHLMRMDAPWKGK